MRILLIGAAGTIGSKVKSHLEAKHEVLSAGRSSGDLRIDIADSVSILKTFQGIGEVDAIVCIAGEAKWDAFEKLTEDDFYIGLKSKLMGQVNLVRIGKDYLSQGGSITLSTGILGDDPVPMTASAAMVNGAIHSFVKAVDLELKGDIRVNAVSLGLVQDAYEKYKDYFPGHTPISMQTVVDAYEESLEGDISGEVLRYYT